MSLGEKIYKLRKVNGLSQENLATKLNVSRQGVPKSLCVRMVVVR